MITNIFHLVAQVPVKYHWMTSWIPNHKDNKSTNSADACESLKNSAEQCQSSLKSRQGYFNIKCMEIWEIISWVTNNLSRTKSWLLNYRQVSNISHTLAGN